MVIEWLVFPRASRSQAKVQLDIRGFLILILLGGLLVILQINRQPLVSGVLLVLMVVGGLEFWQVERHVAHALLDVKLFRQSSFSRNLGASLLNYVGAYFFTLLAPIYLQVLLGLPVALAGMLLMLPPLISLVANPLAGVLSDRVDQGRLMQVGLGLLVLSNLAFALVPGGQQLWPFILVAMTFAVGTALFTNPNSVMLIQSVDAKMRGQVGAATSLARQLGMSIGSAFSSLVFYQVLAMMTPARNLAKTAPAALLTAQPVSYTPLRAHETSLRSVIGRTTSEFPCCRKPLFTCRDHVKKEGWKMDSEPDELISRVNILARQIQHDLDLRLAPTGLNASNYYFILKLGSVEDMRQDTLFKKIHLNASNVTRRLAQLITLGLVTKEKAADDKRAWVISLTAEGRALVPHVSQIVAEYEAELTAKLAAADKVKFEQTLDVLNKTKEDANR